MFFRTFVHSKDNMSENSEERIWFSVGCTSPQKELKVRDDVRRYGLQAFVPLTYVVKSQRGQKLRALVPAISQQHRAVSKNIVILLILLAKVRISEQKTKQKAT